MNPKRVSDAEYLRLYEKEVADTVRDIERETAAEDRQREKWGVKAMSPVSGERRLSFGEWVNIFDEAFDNNGLERYLSRLDERGVVPIDAATGQPLKRRVRRGTARTIPPPWHLREPLTPPPSPAREVVEELSQPDWAAISRLRDRFWCTDYVVTVIVTDRTDAESQPQDEERFNGD